MSDDKDRKDEDPAESLIDALRKLSLHAASELLEIKHRMNELGDQLDGTVFAGGEGSSISKEPRPRPGELVYEAVRMQLEVANQLLTLGHKQADLWIDRARRFGTMLRPNASQTTLRFETRVKQGTKTAHWTPISVYNARRQPVSISLDASEWRPSSGGSAPPKLTIDPSPVPPRSSVEGVIVAPALPEFDPGTYVVDVSVALSGLPVGRLALTLVVDP